MRASLAALLAAALVPAGPASAATEHHVAAIADVYVLGEVTIAAGDSLVLDNLDQDVHDIVARDNDSGGQPYFRSAVITFGRSAVVRGVPALEPSDYPFTCSIHPDMTGTLLVR